jgi:hypothetical protein
MNWTDYITAGLPFGIHHGNTRSYYLRGGTLARARITIMLVSHTQNATTCLNCSAYAKYSIRDSLC